MAIYQTITLAASGSDFVTLIQAQHGAIRSFERTTTAAQPTVKPIGLWTNFTDWGTVGEAIARWDGSAYALLIDLDYPQLNAGGTVAMTAAFNAGNQNISNLLAGSAADHAVRRDQVVLRGGSQTLTANWAVGGFKITGLTPGTDATDAATVGQCQPNNAALVDRILDCQVARNGTGGLSDASTFQPCTAGPNGGFVPSMIALKIAGGSGIRRQVAGAGTGTNIGGSGGAWYFTAHRHTGSPNADADKITVGTFTAGSVTVKVEVEWKFSSTPALRGFWVRLLDAADDSALLATVKANVYGGVGI